MQRSYSTQGLRPWPAPPVSSSRSELAEGNVQGRIRAETMQSLVKNCQKKKNRGGKRRPIAVPVDLGVQFHGRNPARERTLRACVGHGARRLLWPPPLATAVLVMGTLIIGLATMHLD